MKLIKEKYGFSVSIVFVLGLLLLTCNNSNDNKTTLKLSNNEATQNDQWTVYQFPAEEKSREYTDTVISSNLLYTVHLNILYAILKGNNVPLPVSATTYTTGLTVGVKWRPSYIKLDTANQKITYEIVAVTDWFLMGVKLRSEVEPIAGSVTAAGTTVFMQ